MITDTKPFKAYSPEDEKFLAQLRQEAFDKIKESNKTQRQHADDAQIWNDVDTFFSVKYETYKLKIIERDTGLSLRGKKLLEIGSGMGFFLIVSRSLGVDSMGTEPYSDFYEEDRRVGNKLMAHYGLKEGVLFPYPAEKLEFPDNSFDVVSSYYVFEHVADPAKTLKECVRVLKPGGYLHFVFPNYGSFWEGHYAVPWIPSLNRKWGSRYIRWIWRRHPFIVDTLNLLNEKKVLKIIGELGNQIETLSLGKNTFQNEISNLSFDTTGSVRRIKWIFQILKGVGLLKVFVRFALRFGFYTPFYMTLRKR